MNLTTNRIQKFINTRKYEQHQKELNKLVSIHHKEPDDAIIEIYNAREILSNYAKHKGISIDIYDKTPADKVAESIGIKDNKTNLFLKVTNILTGINAQTAVARDTNTVYPKVLKKEVMLHDKKNGNEKISETTSYIQDTFLRNLYRNIQELTEKVTNH